jgi:nickel-type superoxide dismutase maturation protease
MLLSRFKISGHSMQPTYSQDDEVLVSSLPLKFAKPKIGDIVVFEKSRKYYIKRVKNVKENKYYLIGDNKSDSKDSRKFGLIDATQIKGKVIVKL